MKTSLTKKARKVIEEGLGELRQRSSLGELTRIGARMMLEVAIEEEVTAFLGRDYYKRLDVARGYRSGTKPRTIKVGGGDIEIRMQHLSRILCLGIESSVKNLSEFIGICLEYRHRTAPSTLKQPLPLQKQIHLKYLN